MFGFGKKPAPQAQPTVQMAAMPLAINLAGQDKIDHAFGRLDQIARHWEQHDISAQKAAEFTAEALVHVVNLKHSLVNAEAQAKIRLESDLAELIDRLKAQGWEARL